MCIFMNPFSSVIKILFTEGKKTRTDNNQSAADNDATRIMALSDIENYLQIRKN